MVPSPAMTDEARLARHRRLRDADRRHLWHPFTQMSDWLREEPLIVDAGDGPYLVDTLGNRYLDGVSSLWCNVHGHRVPEIDAAIRAQLDRIAHSTLLGLASTASIECAEALAAILRRTRGLQPAEVLRFGRLEIDHGAREVRLDGRARPLTSHQFELLLILARHAGRVMSREALMELARNARLEVFDRSIDVHVSRLRAAIEDDPRRPRRLLTIRGAGYVFARAQDADAER